MNKLYRFNEVRKPIIEESLLYKKKKELIEEIEEKKLNGIEILDLLNCSIFSNFGLLNSIIEEIQSYLQKEINSENENKISDIEKEIDYLIFYKKNLIDKKNMIIDDININKKKMNNLNEKFSKTTKKIKLEILKNGLQVISEKKIQKINIERLIQENFILEDEIKEKEKLLILLNTELYKLTPIQIR